MMVRHRRVFADERMSEEENCRERQKRLVKVVSGNECFAVKTMTQDSSSREESHQTSQAIRV